MNDSLLQFLFTDVKSFLGSFALREGVAAAGSAIDDVMELWQGSSAVLS